MTTATIDNIYDTGLTINLSFIDRQEFNRDMCLWDDGYCKGRHYVTPTTRIYSSPDRFTVWEICEEIELDPIDQLDFNSANHYWHC